MNVRLSLLALVALLAGCRASPYPGWKLLAPDQLPRPSCDHRGGVAVRGPDGALQISKDPAALVGATVGFDSAVRYHDETRDGWLLTRFGCEGELCLGPAMRFVHADGRVDELKPSRGYDAAASTSDGLYLLDKSCNFHRFFTAETSLYLASDLEHEPTRIGGPWPNLCARALAVDDSGSVWLLGSVYSGPSGVQLDDLLLRVEDGQPRVVHRVRHPRDADGGIQQTYTQLTIVDGGMYLSNPTIPSPLLHLHQSEHEFVEQRVVPSSQCRVRRVRARHLLPPDPGYASSEGLQRLAAAGVAEQRYDDSLHILPYHWPLDAIVDLLIEVVPASGTYTIVISSSDEASLEPLQRLPSGFAIEDAWGDKATAELRDRFPQLDPAKR